MKYEEIPSVTTDTVEEALNQNDPATLARVVLAVALYAEEGCWAESVCLRLATHTDEQVRGNAVLGLGHVARVHGRFCNPDVAIAQVQQAHSDDSAYVRSQAEAAMDDVQHFLGLQP